MAVNAFFIATLTVMVIGIVLLQELRFLALYKALIFEKRYGATIAVFATALFVNVFAAVYLLGRKLFLKDTGRKLAHLEKQLRTDGGISEDLAERLGE